MRRALALSRSASRESLPIGAGRLATGRSGVTTVTGESAPDGEPKPAEAAAGTDERPVAVTSGMVSAPGSLFAEDAMLSPIATVAATGTIRSASTPKMVRIQPFCYERRSLARRSASRAHPHWARPSGGCCTMHAL